MRLLKLNVHGGLSLTKDLVHDIPPYVILSHTWSQDEDCEVTFKDVINGSGMDKPGYKKLEFCARQAAQDGLSHIWIDTCCIDKTNSTELSEAINSLFRWYRQANRCYVYLSDVSICFPFRPGQSSGIESLLEAFCQSRWFTRGWTLQELLAPTSVEFFSLEGEWVGSRDTLISEIHAITGIPIQALGGHKKLHSYSVEERMSWAENRKTKREEDAAYCLLGIFDVHMPLIYGEGRKNATARLREEIQRRSQNDFGSKFAPVSQYWFLCSSIAAEFFRSFKGLPNGDKNERKPPPEKVLESEGSTHQPMTINQDGSDFRGAITVSGGVFHQGNSMSFGGTPRISR